MAAPTPASAADYGSPKAPWKNTSAASWPSCGCRKPTRITAGCWRWSPSSRPADRIHRMTVTVAGDQRANRLARQRRLRQEPNHRASRDQIGVVLLSVSGNQNHPSPRQGSLSRQSSGDVETTLRTKVDVEQRDVGPQLGGSLDGLSTGRRHADNHHPLTFQQATSGSQEPRAVINNQTAQRHDTRIAPRLPARLPASRKLERRQHRGTGWPRRGSR